MAKLILVRHAKSEWNSLGLWTGWTDVSLSPDGVEEAKKTAEELRVISIDKTYASPLKRAVETLAIIKEDLDLKKIPTETDDALKERNYGIYTGKNKWEIKDVVGEKTFQKIRRDFDYPIPEGETLKDVYDRVVPFYRNTILADLKSGKNVLIVAHGNSLRALVKKLENLSEEEVANLEIGIAEAYVYSIDSEGKVLGKEIRGRNPNRGKI